MWRAELDTRGGFIPAYAPQLLALQAWPLTCWRRAVLGP